MGIVNRIGQVANKINNAMKPKPNPEAERRRLEDERIRDMEHRERMLAAEDIARARVQGEIRAAKRGPPRNQQGTKAPANKQNWGSRGLENLGLTGGGGGTGGGRNPLIEGLGGGGTRGRRQSSGGGSGLGALIGYDKPRARAPAHRKKKRSSGTTIIIKK